MTGPLLFELARTFASLSLIAIGGANATVPEMHREIVEHLHWMNDRTFVDLIGVAQVAPGPNVIVVSMLGWQVAGLAGFLVASVAMILPSSTLAFVCGRLLQRHAHTNFWRLTKRVLAPIAVGLILASGAVMVRAADHSVLTIAVSVGMTLLAWRTRINPLIEIGTAAVLGVLAGRLGIGIF